MKHIIRTTSGLVLAASLVACGGGGGGGGTAAAPSSSPATLTGANMTVAAQDVMSTAFMPTANTKTLTGAQTLDESVLFSFARAQMDKLPGYMASATSGSTLTGVVQSQTFQCNGGGSMVFSANDADNNNVASAGDTISITFNNCVDTNFSANGSLTFTYNTVTGDPSTKNYSASVTMSFGALTMVSPQASVTANGDLTVAIQQTAANVFSSSISTQSLTVSATYGGNTRTITLSKYKATEDRVADATYGYIASYTLTGTVNSSGLNSGTVSFSTTTPFVKRGSIDLYPSSGVMVVTGANNATLRITVIDNTSVTLECDEDGDGVYEVGPTTVAWSTLS